MACSLIVVACWLVGNEFWGKQGPTPTLSGSSNQSFSIALLHYFQMHHQKILGAPPSSSKLVLIVIDIYISVCNLFEMKWWRSICDFPIERIREEGDRLEAFVKRKIMRKRKPKKIMLDIKFMVGTHHFPYSFNGVNSSICQVWSEHFFLTKTACKFSSYSWKMEAIHWHNKGIKD